MSLKNVEELCKKLKPVIGEKADQIWYTYLAEDVEGKRELETALHIMHARMLDGKVDNCKIFLPPPPSNVLAGEYPIGKVFYDDKEKADFSLREGEWIQHIGIFGRSGSGKTNAAFCLIQELLKAKKPFLVFDWKRNYRDLLAHHDNILVFTVGRDIARFQFNPLIPPKGTNPKTWLKKLNEIIAHAYYLGEGVMYILQKAVDTVYQEFGVYTGTQKYPTMKDVLNWLRNYETRGREAQWMSSTLRAINTLCFGGMGKVLNVSTQISIEDLLTKNIVLELDALTNSDKVFFTEALLLWIHHFRLAQGSREEFKHAIIIEEAHHILLKNKKELTGAEMITDIILREIRELGESIVLIDQHPSLISIPALGNTYCTIAMNLKHRNDVNTASDCMLLPSDEKEYLGRLEVGHAIVKLQGRWFNPFLVRFPLVPLKKGIVTDSWVKSHILRHSRNLGNEAADFRRFQATEKGNPEISPIPASDKGDLTATAAIVSGIERQFIKDIVKFPYSGVVERYKRLGLSRRKGNACKKSLVSKGILETERVYDGNKTLALLKLTRKGKDIAAQLGEKIKWSRRNGGMQHRYWRNKLAEHFRQKGWKATIEYPIGEGKTIDVLIEKQGRKIPIEVETGSTDPSHNIKKDLEAGFDYVIVAATNRDAMARMQSKIAQSDRVRIVECNNLTSAA